MSGRDLRNMKKTLADIPLPVGSMYMVYLATFG